MNKSAISLTVALLLSAGSATFAFAQGEAGQKAIQASKSNVFRTGIFSTLALKMNGDTVACVNSAQKLVPASNMKLITTGVALLKLGADFRFETKLGYTGEVEKGVLKGDLYIVGGGDPTTGSSSPCAESLSALFGKWKGLLDEAGIKKIEGRIIGDPRFFGMQSPESDGWTMEDVGAYYGSGPRGLNFYENAQHFYVTPAATEGGRNFVRPRYPETPWMTVSNISFTSKANSANTLFYINTGFGPFGEIRGQFPINGRGCTLECDNEYGAFTCAFYFFRYLASQGIDVKGGFGDVSPLGFIRTDLHFSEYGTSAPEQEELTIIGSTFSPTLAEIIADTNKLSDNFFAETLMHMVGKKMTGLTEYDNCRSAFEQALAAAGAKTGDSCRIYDGSGLSRKNYVSAEYFVKFLRAMASKPDFETYLKSLACPMDKKSTVSGMFWNYPDEFRSRIYCKSGSMNGVRCYSGYILSSDGDPSKTIVFSVMTNNVTMGTGAVSGALQKVIASYAAEN